MIAFALIVCGEDVALLLRVIADVAKALIGVLWCDSVTVGIVGASF